MSHLTRLSLCLLRLLGASSGAQADGADPEVRVTAADPPRGGRFAARDTVYLKLTYRSAVPLRFRAEGYLGEAKVVRGAMYNPAPPYPAGEHDALAWIAFREPARIDELRITVSGADWKPLRTLSYPIAAEWVSGGSPRARAAWAAQLSDAQQAMATAAMAAHSGQDEPDGLFSFLITFAAVSIPGYLLLQIYMLVRYSGGWRIAAGVPLLVMVPIGLYTLAALVMGSNLWPLMLLFLSPPAFLYLIGLLILRLLMRILAPA